MRSKGLVPYLVSNWIHVVLLGVCAYLVMFLFIMEMALNEGRHSDTAGTSHTSF